MSTISSSGFAGYMQSVGQTLTDDTTQHIATSAASSILGATAEVAEG